MLSRETVLVRKAEMDAMRLQAIANINELEAQKQQHMANMNACVGAMQDCDHWLAMIDAEEAAAAEAEAEKLNGGGAGAKDKGAAADKAKPH